MVGETKAWKRRGRASGREIGRCGVIVWSDGRGTGRSENDNYVKVKRTGHEVVI